MKIFLVCSLLSVFQVSSKQVDQRQEMLSSKKVLEPFKDLVLNHIKSNNIAVFSKSYCPYCKKAKGLLETNGLEYKAIELDIAKEGTQMQEYLKELSGQRTVPNIYVKGKHLGGSDDLAKAFERGTLMSMLKDEL
jgi:glutaredoxin